MLEIPGILDAGLGRRRFLTAGVGGLLGVLLNQDRLDGQPQDAGKIQGLRSCILLTLYGGPSHLDTWDMKPDAPIEVRGEYRPISTNVPGRFVCEHLSACARNLDKLAVVRSMHHGMSNHNSAMYQVLVGRSPVSNSDVLGANRFRDFPNHGAVISQAEARGRLAPTKSPITNIALPHVLHNVVDLPGQNAGFLGGGHDPLQINSDPNSPDFEVRNLRPPTGVSVDRIAARRALLQSLDRAVAADSEPSIDAYRRRALELRDNRQIQQAFQIDRESAKVRERYGRHTLGQSLLLARRLAESGVRFINVNDKIYNGQEANWDSHQNIFPRHRELLPPTDQALSALLEDLQDRGLLESTLVVVTGEFGRTPRVNAAAGRDHWPDCYSVLLAGGGVEGGAVYGASDRHGAYPLEDPVTPADLAATLFWRFGLDPKMEISDRLGRPFPVTNGKPLQRLFTRRG